MSNTTEEKPADSDQLPAGKGSDSNDLLGAAMRLVGKMKIIHGLPEYKSVWQCAQNHQGDYKGPTYELELNELESAIKAEHAKIFPA